SRTSRSCAGPTSVRLLLGIEQAAALHRGGGAAPTQARAGCRLLWEPCPRGECFGICMACDPIRGESAAPTQARAGCRLLWEPRPRGECCYTVSGGAPIEARAALLRLQRDGSPCFCGSLALGANAFALCQPV